MNVLDRFPPTARLLVVDTETTGLDRWSHQPWQVAWADVTDVVHGAARKVAVEHMVLPHTLDGADPLALEIGQYPSTPPVPAGPDAVRDLWTLMGGGTTITAHKPRIIGSNPAFDMGMLSGTFHRAGMPSTEPWYQRGIDVADIALWGLGWTSDSGDPLGLSRLAERLGVPTPAAHTAPGDVQTTVSVLAGLLTLLRAAPAPAR